MPRKLPASKLPTCRAVLQSQSALVLPHGVSGFSARPVHSYHAVDEFTVRLHMNQGLSLDRRVIRTQSKESNMGDISRVGNKVADEVQEACSHDERIHTIVRCLGLMLAQGIWESVQDLHVCGG